jgi:nucleotidyltransferase/DNA polymerase involved in DNA repair
MIAVRPKRSGAISRPGSRIGAAALPELVASAEEAIEETLTFHRLSRQNTPIIEPLSLDEAYLDVTENQQGIPLARDVALAIRGKIKETTGLNASAGISYNKFLAKLASDHRKPNGQYVITPEMGPRLSRSCPSANSTALDRRQARR